MAERRDLRTRLRETAGVLANARRTLALVARVDAKLLAAIAAAHLGDALTAVAVAYVGKQIIDAVVTAARTPGHPTRAAFGWVAAELVLVTLRSVLTQANQHGTLRLRTKLGLWVNVAILEKASNVSYPHFEDPGFVNQLAQARREASSRPLDVVSQTLALGRNGVTLAGYAALLVALGPWAIAALLLATVPAFLVEARHGREVFAQQRARTQRNRQAFYLESVLTTEQSAKEVKLFALGRWLIGRYRQVHEEFNREELALARRRARAALALGLLSSAVFYGTYLAIVARAAAGAITLGAMTLYLTVFRQGQASLQGALGALARIYEDNLFMTNLFEYLAVPDDEPDLALEPTDGMPERAPSVVFEHVSYRYPGASRDALTDVSLAIAPGETIALVGRNGAGKTTLIKLLVGLYRPSSGRILIDGVDAATLDTATLRKQIGVIFQDFVRFHFSAGDNVGVGWLPAREDEQAISAAVLDAGARDVVEQLPRGLATPLGRAFGGDDLSIGQWQRIALARAFMRRSKILVLDEPTAAMDAEAEHEIFQRFRDLKSGRTALLITHRFSTVRMADRVAVFDGGRLVELGTHAELLAQGGRYATMFELQARGYRDEPAASADGSTHP